MGGAPLTLGSYDLLQEKVTDSFPHLPFLKFLRLKVAMGYLGRRVPGQGTASTEACCGMYLVLARNSREVCVAGVQAAGITGNAVRGEGRLARTQLLL